MAADTEIEIEIEAMAVAATTGRDSTMVMGTMILANEGISLRTTSGLLGGSPRFEHFSFSIFLSPFVGVRHAIHVSKTRWVSRSSCKFSPNPSFIGHASHDSASLTLLRQVRRIKVWRQCFPLFNSKMPRGPASAGKVAVLPYALVHLFPWLGRYVINVLSGKVG